MTSPRPRISRRFSFDYDPGQKGRSHAPVDEILDSMNRTTQAGEILDYDPEIESYVEDQANKSGRSRKAGMLIFGLMLVSGVGLLWSYGGLTKVMDAAWLRSRYNVLGQSIPVWMGLAAMILLFFAVALSHQRRLPGKLEISN